MSVTLEYRGRHGLYGAQVMTCVRVVDIVQETYDERGVSAQWGIQATLADYVLTNHGMDDFLDEETEEDALVILASFAPGGSEWGSNPHNLEDVQRFWKSVRESAVRASADQEQADDEAARWRESSACNQARGGM